MSSTALAYPVSTMLCEPLSNRVDKEDRELKNFEHLVMDPLRQDKKELDRLFDIEVNGPNQLAAKNRELSSANNSLASEISKLQADIKIYEDRIAELERLAQEHEQRGENNKAKEKRQKANEIRKDNTKRERKIAENSSRIERNNGAIDANTARITEIQTTAPTRQEIEVKLDEVNQKLANVANVRREKEEDLRNTLYALDVCVAYEVLKDNLAEVKALQGWQTDRNRCATSWPSPNPGVEMARRDARLITGCP